MLGSSSLINGFQVWKLAQVQKRNKGSQCCIGMAALGHLNTHPWFSLMCRSSNTFVGCPSVLILGMSSSTNHHHISFLVVLLSTLSLMLTLIIAPTLILMIKYTSTVWGSYPWCYQKAQFNNISHRQPQPTENSQPWTSHYWTPFMHLFHILGEDVLACPQSTGPLYIHWCGSDHHMIYLLPSGMSPKDSQVTLSAGGFFWLFIVYPL